MQLHCRFVFQPEDYGCTHYKKLCKHFQVPLPPHPNHFDSAHCNDYQACGLPISHYLSSRPFLVRSGCWSGATSDTNRPWGGLSSIEQGWKPPWSKMSELFTIQRTLLSRATHSEPCDHSGRKELNVSQEGAAAYATVQQVTVGGSSNWHLYDLYSLWCSGQGGSRLSGQQQTPQASVCCLFSSSSPVQNRSVKTPRHVRRQ